MPGWEWEDEAGVVHTNDEPMAGEAMERGPVVLSWADVEASQDWDAAGMNLAIHEFAHKLDMRNGAANGCPPLPPEMAPHIWKRTMLAAYEHFQKRVDRGERTAIDPYAAESPAEFFAVLSEVFFVEPQLLRHEYPAVYQQFARVLPAGAGGAERAAARRLSALRGSRRSTSIARVLWFDDRSPKGDQP